jgi:hypothetical protein
MRRYLLAMLSQPHPRAFFRVLSGGLPYCLAVARELTPEVLLGGLLPHCVRNASLYVDRLP